MDRLRTALLTIVILLPVCAAGRIRAAESPIVRAVLFASPTCSHCEFVRTEVLPPLVSRYGPRLQIAVVNTQTESGNELFLNACMKHGLLRLSVPLLIVGNTAMVGSDEIPKKFPALIEKQLAEGGIDWPQITGLNAMLAANPAYSAALQPGPEPPAEAAASTPATSAAGVAAETSAKATQEPVEKAAVSMPPPPAPESSVSKQAAAPTPQSSDVSPNVPPAGASAGAGTVPQPQAASKAPSGLIDLTSGEAEIGVIGRIRRDIYGNGLAILVLAGMVVTLLMSPLILRKSPAPATPSMRPRYDWLIPILAVAGLGVAAYLSNVEVRQVEAVCGPVGDCNTVNQSEYAKLFGILPIGVLGLFGFLAILTAWMLRRWGSGRISLMAAVAILGLTAFGTLFSIYLTFLEPFVIGATCLWCLSSAVIMTTLFVLALRPGRQAWMALGANPKTEKCSA